MDKREHPSTLPAYFAKYYGIGMMNANLTTMVIAEALLFPDAESILAAVGGSMGKTLCRFTNTSVFMTTANVTMKDRARCRVLDWRKPLRCVQHSFGHRGLHYCSMAKAGLAVGNSSHCYRNDKIVKHGQSILEIQMSTCFMP